jgi:hypothetical protein
MRVADVRGWLRELEISRKDVHDDECLGLTQPPVQRVPVFLPGVRRRGRGCDYRPHLAPRLKKE